MVLHVFSCPSMNPGIVRLLGENTHTWLQGLLRYGVASRCSRPGERQRACPQQPLRCHREALVEADGRHEQSATD